MYFSRKYWKLLIYIYKLNYINLNTLERLNKETVSYLPYIFKNLNIINLYDGKTFKSFPVRNTNFKLKKLL